MKLCACWLLAWVGLGVLQAADPTNAPPAQARADAVSGLLPAKPDDVPQDVQPLERLRAVLSKRPAGANPDVLRDWLTTVVIHSEQFLADRKDSPRAGEVRALNAQYRSELATLTEDRAKRDKAVAPQVIANNDKAPVPRQGSSQAAKPDKFNDITEQARRITRDSGPTSAKPRSSKKANAETLADTPDITEADRRAALTAAATKILKAEEELMSWTELETLFGAKNPPSPEGRAAWYQDMAARCEQFVKDFPVSPHANIVRINEGRCRLVLYQTKKDPAQRARAEVVARQVLVNKPNEDDAIRAEFILLNSTWPDRPEQGVAVAKRIVKDFPHRREAAAAMLMHAQFRRRQGLLNPAKAVAEELLAQYPGSAFAFNARSLITQCDLIQQPCPPLKLTGLKGEAMNTEALRGKPFLIEFWSAIGGKAEEETAKLFQLYLKYHPKGFEIFTICVDKSREAMDIFQLQHAIPWPRHWDGQGMNSVAALRFGVDTTPMRFLVEPTAHRIVSSHISPEALAQALELWIDQGQPPAPPGQEKQAPGVSGFLRKFFGF